MPSVRVELGAPQPPLVLGAALGSGVTAFLTRAGRLRRT
jgi:hypothetical protein